MDNCAVHHPHLAPLLLRGLPPKVQGWKPRELAVQHGSIPKFSAGLFYGDGSDNNKLSSSTVQLVLGAVHSMPAVMEFCAATRSCRATCQVGSRPCPAAS